MFERGKGGKGERDRDREKKRRLTKPVNDGFRAGPNSKYKR